MPDAFAPDADADPDAVAPAAPSVPPETQAAFDALVEQRAIVEADWARAEAAGGLPFPRGRAWATKDLPEDAVLVDQSGRLYRRNASGELRRIKGLHSEEDAK